MGEWSLWAAAHHRPPGSDGQVQVLLTSCHIAVATDAAGEVRGGDMWVCGGLRGRGARIFLTSQNLCNTPSSCLPSSPDRARWDVCARAQTRAVSLGDTQGLFFYKAALRLKDLQSFTSQCRCADAWTGGGVISSVTAAFVQQSAEVKQTQRRQMRRCASIDIFFLARNASKMLHHKKTLFKSWIFYSNIILKNH